MKKKGKFERNYSDEKKEEISKKISEKLKEYHKNKPDELKGKIIRKREEVEKYGSTLDEINRSIKKRKVKRPDKDELFNYVEKYGQVKAGEKYGVSQVSIHNWIKWYKKNEGYIDSLKDEE